jgi:hypothetical protein
VAGDRRTRRLIEEPVPVHQTLDHVPTAPELPVELDPPELLDAPPAQDAAARLEERQKRWFRLREEAMKARSESAPLATDSGEQLPTDPKG